ncbi:hypothetical protein EJ110_NYTH51498 [Nymphaea thermarum]|nr:hypothetical protein EJ110_NYTH51498 [Nymphaea thermarum]
MEGKEENVRGNQSKRWPKARKRTTRSLHRCPFLRLGSSSRGPSERLGSPSSWSLSSSLA